jgi:putative ABC transport system permease protein
MAALRAHPDGVFVESQTADDLSVERGDRVQVLLARGTKHQILKKMTVLGLFERFPGFPRGTDLIASLAFYEKATNTHRVDFFLARADDRSPDGVTRAVAALRDGPGRRDPIDVESTGTALDEDRSSLTALNVTGLVDLDMLFTLLMSAAAIAIFVFGLMLQRRREYVTLRALGAQGEQVRAMVVGEAGVVVLGGLVAGLVVGTGMAFLLVRILRPLFVLDPGTTFPAILRRLAPTELLRET